MKNKTLYQANFRLNGDGAKFSTDLDSILMDIFEDYVGMGYHMSEITSIAHSCVSLCEAKMSLKHSDGIDREIRKINYKDTLDKAKTASTK